MTQATKRPWKVFQEDTIINDDGVYVGRCDWSPTPDKANARLIVKAVNNHDKLVEALIESQVLLTCLTQQGWNAGVTKEAKELLPKIKQALKESEGI